MELLQHYREVFLRLLPIEKELLALEMAMPSCASNKAWRDGEAKIDALYVRLLGVEDELEKIREQMTVEELVQAAELEDELTPPEYISALLGPVHAVA